MECVITRYNEYINWIKFLPDEITKITVYNKGFNDNLFNNNDPMNDSVLNKLNIKRMKNIGRMEHTIAHYIIENYDQLPEVLLFITANILMNPEKGKYLGNITRNINKIKNNYKGFYSPRFKKVKNNYNYSFKIKENNINNELIDNDSKSEFKNFQEWKSVLIDNEDIHYVAYRSNFAVCRENIKNIPLKIYENILESLSTNNLENSFFVERIWAHLFRKYSYKLITTENNINTILTENNINTILTENNINNLIIN